MRIIEKSSKWIRTPLLIGGFLILMVPCAVESRQVPDTLLPSDRPAAISIKFPGAQFTALSVYEKGDKIYLADDNSESILVIDGKTNKQIGTLSGIGGSVFEVVVNEKYGKVYAFSEKNCCSTGFTPGNGLMSAIDTSTDKVVKTIALSGFLTNSFIRLLNDPVLNKIYVGDADDSSGFGIVDPLTDQMTRVPGAPRTHPWLSKMGLNTVTSEVFYTTSTVELVIVDVKNLTYQRVPFPANSGKALDLAVNEKENKVYLTMIDVPGQAYMGIAILNRKTGAFSFVGASDLEPIVFNNSSNRLFTGVQIGPNRGSIVDGATDQLTYVDIGVNGISAIAVRESTDRAYLVTSSTVIVDGATKSALLEIPSVGGSGVVVNRSNGKVYIRNTDMLLILDDTQFPGLDITMSKPTYVDGDTATATEFRVRNPFHSPVKVRLKVWLKVPTVGEVTLINIGGDGSFSLPADLNVNAGPLSLIQITTSFPPKGNWEFNTRVENPTTGAVLTEDINKFVIQ